MAELVGEYISAAEIQAAEAAGATSAELSSIADLKAYAERFSTAFRTLLSWDAEVRGTALQPEYDRLVSRGFDLQERIAGLIATVRSALDWIGGVFGSENASWSIGTWLYDLTHPDAEGMSAVQPVGLGLAWFIPVAAIVAVVGAVTIWLADYAKFAKKVAEQRRISQELQAEGVSAREANRQAAEIIREQSPALFEFAAGNLATPLLLAGLVAGGLWLWSRR